MDNIFEDIFYIIGLDPSLACTGVAVFEVNPKSRSLRLAAAKVISTPPFERDNRFNRYRFISDSILDIVKEYNVKLAGIEGYSFKSKGRASLDLPELGGVVRLGLISCGIPFVEIPPPVLKKTITGKGNNYDKLIMIKSVNTILEANFKNDEISHNAADAAGLGLCLIMKLLDKDFNYDLVLEEISREQDEKNEEKRLKRLRKKYGKNIPEKSLKTPKKKNENPEGDCVVLDVDF